MRFSAPLRLMKTCFAAPRPSTGAHGEDIARPWALSSAGLATALVALAVAGLTFGVFPGLDLGVASLFYAGNNRFTGQGPGGEALRRLFYWLPFGIFILVVVLYLLRRFGPGLCATAAGAAALRGLWAPSLRGLLFVTCSLVLGPGLLVNTALKDHWHRPRPVQVTAFGGTMDFRPFYRRDGACVKNCSFVSGEGSIAVWQMAPALLAPPPLRTLTLGASLLVATATGVTRMAFGGHFLSDTIFSALFTWLIIIASARVTRPPEC